MSAIPAESIRPGDVITCTDGKNKITGTVLNNTNGQLCFLVFGMRVPVVRLTRTGRQVWVGGVTCLDHQPPLFQ